VSATDVGGTRLRLVFDVTFFVVVGTIGLNIVFGIIVDAFSQLRDEKVQITLRSICEVKFLYYH